MLNRMIANSTRSAINLLVTAIVRGQSHAALPTIRHAELEQHQMMRHIDAFPSDPSDI